MNYVELYPNEAYILLNNKKLRQKKELSEQLGKLFRDIRGMVSGKNQSMVIVSRAVSTVEELPAQQERIARIQDEVFGYHDKILFVDDYFTNAEHYAKDMELIIGELKESIETLDAELIRKESEKLVRAIGNSGQRACSRKRTRAAC